MSCFDFVTTALCWLPSKEGPFLWKSWTKQAKLKSRVCKTYVIPDYIRRQNSITILPRESARPSELPSCVQSWRETGVPVRWLTVPATLVPRNVFDKNTAGRMNFGCIDTRFSNNSSWSALVSVTRYKPCSWNMFVESMSLCFSFVRHATWKWHELSGTLCGWFRYAHNRYTSCSLSVRTLSRPHGNVIKVVIEMWAATFSTCRCAGHSLVQGVLPKVTKK